MRGKRNTKRKCKVSQNPSEFELIKKIVEILEEKKINWWIDHGTLLGFEREGKPLEWDTDFDIGTNATPNELLCEILPKIKLKGIKAHFDDSCDALKIKKNNYTKPWSIDIACYTCDQNLSKKYWPSFSDFTSFQFFIFSLIIFLSEGSQKINGKFPRIVFLILDLILRPVNLLIRRNYRRKINLWLKKYIPLKENKVESKYFEEMKCYKYGEVSLRAPKLVAEYLEKRYGLNWRTPDKTWDYLVNDGGLKR